MVNLPTKSFVTVFDRFCKEIYISYLWITKRNSIGGNTLVGRSILYMMWAFLIVVAHEKPRSSSHEQSHCISVLQWTISISACTFGQEQSFSFKKKIWNKTILPCIILSVMLLKIGSNKNYPNQPKSQILLFHKSHCRTFLDILWPCVCSQNHVRLIESSQTSWMLLLEFFRIDPCTNNYFNIQGVPA